MPTIKTHHAAMLELIERGKPLRFDLSAVKAADVSLVQLLIAARRSSQSRGLPFAITAASDSVTAAFAAAGVPWSAVADLPREA